MDFYKVLIPAAQRAALGILSLLFIYCQIFIWQQTSEPPTVRAAISLATMAGYAASLLMVFSPEQL
jgi:hypothetical protein